MAKAPSFKTEPWTSFDRESYSIFEDDFVHDKVCTIKANIKSDKSTVNLKETLTEKQGKLNTAGEIKFWFPLAHGKTAYGKVKNDSIKLHYDHGVLNHHGYAFNAYGSIQAKKSFEDQIFKAGVETVKDDFRTNFRLRWVRKDNGLTLYNKTVLNYSEWKFSAFKAFNLNTKELNHAGVQVGWTDNKVDFFLRLKSPKWDKFNLQSFLSTVTFDYIRKYDANNRLGLQIDASLTDQKIKQVAAIWETKSDNSTYKAKINKDRNLTFSAKHQLGGYGNYVWGVNIHDFGKTNKFSWGVQVDLNL